MQKKILGLTAALLLITTGVMYAQELKFDGYINSGVGVVVNNKDNSDPYFKAFGVDSEQNGYRFRLNGAYTNEAKNAGIRFRFQSQANLSAQGAATTTVDYDDEDESFSAVTGLGLPTAAGYFSLPYAFGWVSFLNNIFTVNLGIIEDSTWTTGDWWLASNSVSDFAGLGLLLKVAPIDGLALGVGGYAINRRGGSNNNGLNNYDLGSFVKLEDIKLTFHAAYTMKDVFRLGLSYRMENKAGTPNAATGEASILYGEFRYLGMKDLTAAVAASITRLGMDDFSTAGNMIFSETFGYKIGDDLNLGLNAVQFMYNRATSYSPSLLFNLWGSYAFGKIVPRLDFVYFMNGNSTTTGTNNGTWHRKGFANQAYSTDGNPNNLSVFSARPSVKINLDGRTFLEIGDMINFDFGKREVSAYGNKTSMLTNVFYIDAKWSF